jgi:hypothetical protein
MDADDAVLVVLMNNPRDMEIARNKHWYRVPVKHASSHITHARYLAFYLTSAFGDRRWSIREYAPVCGHELVRRRDLFEGETDHPRANDAYYKLQLGSIIQIARPITSRTGRRVLFIGTTGDKFSRAVELNDLLGKSEADDSLWDALKAKEIAAERQVVVRDARARYRVDYWIRCVQGNIAIVLGKANRKLPKGKGWQGLVYSEEDIFTAKDKCLREVQRLVRELGGNQYKSAGADGNSH